MTTSPPEGGSALQDRMEDFGFQVLGHVDLGFLKGGAETYERSEQRVGPKGYIHGWIFVGVPIVGADVSHPTHGKGHVATVTKTHVTVAWHGKGGTAPKPAGAHSAYKKAIFTHPQAVEHESKAEEASMKMFEAHEQGKSASLKSYYKKKAADHLSAAATIEAKHKSAQSVPSAPAEQNFDAPNPKLSGPSDADKATANGHLAKAKASLGKMATAGSPSMKTYYKKQAAGHQAKAAELLKAGGHQGEVDKAQSAFDAAQKKYQDSAGTPGFADAANNLADAKDRLKAAKAGTKKPEGPTGPSAADKAAADGHLVQAKAALDKMANAGSPSMKTYYKKQAADHQAKAAELLKKAPQTSHGAPADHPGAFTSPNTPKAAVADSGTPKVPTAADVKALKLVAGQKDAERTEALKAYSWSVKQKGVKHPDTQALLGAYTQKNKESDEAQAKYLAAKKAFVWAPVGVKKSAAPAPTLPKAADDFLKGYKGHHIPGGVNHQAVRDFLAAHQGVTPLGIGKGESGTAKHTEVHAALDKEFEGAKYSSAERAAITKYTGSSYTTINGALRVGGFEKGTADSATKKTIADLDKSMRPLTKDYKVYRSFGSSKTLEGIKEGDVIADPGFNSTSTHFGTFGASGTVLHITAPAGTKGAWAKPISSHASENELILDRGTPFVVTKIEKGQGGGTHVHVTALPHEAVGANTKTSAYQKNSGFIWMIDETRKSVIEHRSASISGSTDGDTLHGLVTPFNIETQIGDAARGGFFEKINPGAFTKTLEERDVVLVHNHDPAMPLARTSVTEGPGSLKLTPDPTAGLRAEAIPVQTSVGLDVLKLAKAKVIRGMSFGFEVLKDRWSDGEGRAMNAHTGTHREILEVRLHEVTTTAFPAYPTTELSARDSLGATADLLEARGYSFEERAEDDGEPCHCLAAVDASLDSAMTQLQGVDRNELPPEINQFIDLVAGAAHLMGAHNSEVGIPDPDKPNGSTYSEPAATTPDDDERAHNEWEARFRAAYLSHDLV